MQESTVKERLIEFLKFKKISQRKFELSINVGNGFVNNIVKGIGADKLQSILYIYPDLNGQWLITGEGPMLKEEVEKKSEETETRPRIPYTAAAGTLTEAMSGVTATECEQIPVVKYLPEYNFTIVAYGDSMLPEIVSGDEMACRTIKDTSYIQWGRVYVLDTDSGIVVKRVYDAGDSIRCVSNNKDYPDFNIPKSEIRSMHLMVGLIRRY